MIKRLLILFVLIELSGQVHAQFFRGVGIFVGPNTSRQRYKNLNFQDTINMLAYIPPSHKSAELPSWTVGIFVELLKKKHIRWQTELEFTHKGATEKPLLNPYTGQRGAGVNSYTYIQWNNYAKFLLEEGYRGFWYGMLGPKLEYNMSRATPAYAPWAGALPKINVSADVGVGYEFLAYSPFKFFAELHYNPDVYPQGVRDRILITNRTWELRVGIVYRPQKALDDCNAPRYHGQ
ncbi:MAG: hypothetical protein JST26_13520 [Bacteroidetes bacterium]|nr:hypothetical protein [Bacteroidota bacterium]